MAGFETLDVRAHMQSLRDDPVLKSLFPGGRVQLHGDFAPREPPPFYIVFAMTSAPDTNAIGGYRAFTSPSYMVQCVGREKGFDVLRPIMERVDFLLTNEDASAMSGSTFIYRFIRINTIEEIQGVDSVRWWFLGGNYDTVIFTYDQPAP